MKCANNEILFVVSTNMEGFEEDYPFVVAITPVSYWKKRHCQYDGYVENKFLEENFGAEMECVLSPFDGSLSKNDVTKMLLNAGFIQDEKFTAFMSQGQDEDDEDVPGTGEVLDKKKLDEFDIKEMLAATPSAKSSYKDYEGSGTLNLTPTTGKLSTEILKRKICEFIKGHPGCAKGLWDAEESSQIDEVELQKEKVWKRENKRKEGNTIVRTFNATGSSQLEVAEQLKVFVTSDSTDIKILSIELEG